jgi:hypothetical protein
MGRQQKLSEPEDLPVLIQYSKLSGEKAWSNQQPFPKVISTVLLIVIVLKLLFINSKSLHYEKVILCIDGVLSNFSSCSSTKIIDH